jgi:hypothetical protein
MSKIQNEDIKSLAELLDLGLDASSLPPDYKIFVSANLVNKTLKDAIEDGDLTAVETSRAIAAEQSLQSLIESNSIQQVCIYPQITGQMLLDKGLSLPLAPKEPNKVLVDIFSGGGPATYDEDFIVSDDFLSWDGKGLQSVLDTSDRLRIYYLA